MGLHSAGAGISGIVGVRTVVNRPIAGVVITLSIRALHCRHRFCLIDDLDLFRLMRRIGLVHLVNGVMVIRIGL